MHVDLGLLAFVIACTALVMACLLAIGGVF